MVVRCYLFETRGGALVTELEPSRVSWSEQSNTAETLNATLLPEPGLRNLLTPWKHSLAFDVGGRLLGGPLVPSSYDGDAHEVQVTARGLRYALDRVPILPVAALTAQISPSGVPNPAMDTTISGVDLGTIGKKLIQQVMTWPGWGDVPVTFPADRAGTATRTYTAVELKTVESALSDLSGVQNGPDIRLRLTRPTQDSFGWVYESGTDVQPRLQGEVPLTWEPDDTSGLQIREDPQVMGSVSWSTGGRSTDKTLVRSLYDPTLVNVGFPLLHLESDASSSVTDEGTLDAWNQETLRVARVAAQFWSFKVPVDRSPFPFEYNPGDLVTVIIDGHEYLPDDDYTRRIVGLSGDASDFITVTCGATYGGA